MSQEFLNATIYSIGDIFVDRGGDTSNSSGSGSEYSSYEYYEYNGDSATEQHQSGEEAPGATVRNESFHYYSDSFTGVINDVSQYLDLHTYDFNIRATTIERTSNHQYELGEETRTETSAYTYVDSTSLKLLSSTETEESLNTSYEFGYSDYRRENITYSYDYSGRSDSEIDDELDYSTRWGLGTSFYQDENGDNNAFNVYSKESRDKNNSSEEWQEFKIETTESGFIINTHISSDQNSRSGSTYTNVDTSDYNQDGIIEYRHEYSQRQKGNNTTIILVEKHDYDGDGQADDIYMSREKSSRSGTQRTEYRYDTQSEGRPILEIIKSRNDQIISENPVFRTLTSRHTNMGEHVLELTDVLA